MAETIVDNIEQSNLKKIDWILLITYLGIHLILGVVYALNLYDREWIQDFYFIIPFIFVFLIFDIYHKRLWNNKVLLIWGIIGLIQTIVYYYYHDLPQIQAVNGNDLIWLKALPLTVLTSFIFNLINKRIYGDNFIVTSLRLDPNRIDPKDGRKLRPADYIFSLSGFLIIIFGTVFTN
ncbi:hypothetical protein GWK08_16705 [Leptobacterium flavescens]|uniref:Uncharacterized protein n=1 Tax=Leptobacterium flavescens TaxID=472055 RepID=A0A6P0UQ60_9FLAO|nr:hypothetical protein [Leptobacterium flavescens]NER15097.1 hypothetical protein [Leptobacterium flavescens]